MGLILAVNPTEKTLSVAFGAHVARYENGDLEDLTHAYAVTVHKSQGSEFPLVVMPLLTSHYMMLQRSLPYRKPVRFLAGGCHSGKLLRSQTKIQERTMSDNLKRYTAIKRALVQLYPQAPPGHLLQSLNVLAMFINGIVASKSTHTREVAKKTPTDAKVTSREKQCSRWYQNAHVTYELHMLPFGKPLLLGLAQQTLVLAIAGSEVGRNCLALMVSVIYHKRAIPLLWVVVQGRKGHFPAQLHVDLLTQLQDLLPPAASIVLLGDGEFDSVELQTFLAAAHWDYVCRTAKNTQVFCDGAWQALDEIPVWPGSRLPLYDVLFTRQAYGPVLAIIWWDKQHAAPIYLVTNLAVVEEACHWYRRRMRIETFFSDQKSRGFQLHKSHISQPQRLARLLIAACLAYIWMIHLGALCQLEGWKNVIHRTDRCDLSLFQLGLDLLEYFLNEDMPIPVDFRLYQAPLSG